MRKLDILSTTIVLLLGIGHTVMTPVFAPGLTEATLWFSGAGLALVFLGALNWVRLLAPSRTARLICVAANGLALVWIGLVVFVLPVPQAFAAGLGVLGAMVTSVLAPRVSS